MNDLVSEYQQYQDATAEGKYLLNIYIFQILLINFFFSFCRRRWRWWRRRRTRRCLNQPIKQRQFFLSSSIIKIFYSIVTSYESLFLSLSSFLLLYELLSRHFFLCTMSCIWKRINNINETIYNKNSFFFCNILMRNNKWWWMRIGFVFEIK